MHLERTADPTVLRWVRHDRAMAACAAGRLAVPATTPLGTLLAAGTIAEVRRAGGDLLVSIDDAGRWPAVVADVDAAVAALGAEDARWLLADPLHDPPGALPGVDAVQRVLDAAAAALFAAHGGAMVVTSVRDGVVELRALGGCRGCAGTDRTVLDHVVPALRRAYPAVRSVTVVDDPPARAAIAAAPTGPAGARRARWRLRLGGAGGCH